MSLFKKLFGGRSEAPADLEAQQQFDAEWRQAVTRFGIVTGLGAINIGLKHPQTNQPMPPHEGLGGTFADWKPIRAPYDRRALLFDLIANTVGGSMNLWQTANYLTADRRPDEALALLERHEPPAPENEDYASHCAAYAKAYIGLTRYAEALSWARKATEAAPDNAHFQTILADALHLSGQCEAAHEIYSQQMEMAPPSTSDPSHAVAEMFQNLFARETGVVSSPVLALEIGESLNDPAQAEEFWRLAETEFYDSPYFRMHHAYYLANAGATDQSFAKLMALVQEMPWVREASLNLERYFAQYDPSGKKMMPEFQAQLRRTIQENGWTTEGMHEIEIGHEE